MNVEGTLRAWASAIALGVEAAAALLIAIGAIQALWRTLSPLMARRQTLGEKKLIWLHFARWLVLALEFELGADIVRTAISPDWQDIGQLGAIAVIRTFLNFFLERDMEKVAQPAPPPEQTAA